MKTFKKKYDTLLVALIAILIFNIIGYILISLDGFGIGKVAYLLISILFVQIIRVIFINHFYITLSKDTLSINYTFWKKRNKSFQLSDLDAVKITSANRIPGVTIDIKKGNCRFSNVSFLLGNKDAEMLKQELNL